MLTEMMIPHIQISNATLQWVKIRKNSLEREALYVLFVQLSDLYNSFHCSKFRKGISYLILIISVGFTCLFYAPRTFI